MMDSHLENEVGSHFLEPKELRCVTGDEGGKESED